MASVNTIVSGALLGSEGNDAQFKVPVLTKTGVQGQQIRTISMENYRVRKIIDVLKKLVDISIVDGPDEIDRKEKWKQAVSHYCLLLQIMRKKVIIIQQVN